MGNCFTDERFEKLNSKCNFNNIKLNDEVKIVLDLSNQSIKQKLITNMTDTFAGADSIPERVCDWNFDKHLDN